MNFSIIIPVYNAEKTLRRCLDSVKQQIYTDFEVIMVNDGSSDESEHICQQYANQDHRFKYIYQNNLGVSMARNKGLDVSSGEFIVFLDSDDSYEKEYLKEFSILIRNYPDYSSYWCGYNSIIVKNNQKRIITYDKEGITSINKKHVMYLHEKVLDAFPVNKVFRKDIIDKYNIRMNPQLSLGEDLLFNFEYLNYSENEILVLNKPLYNYYIENEDSLDRKYRENMLQIYKVLNDELKKYLDVWNVDQDQYTLFYNSVFYSYERILRNTMRSECKKTFIKKIGYNNSILRLNDFQESLKNRNCYVHPLYLTAYKLKNYFLVVILDKCLKLKNKMIILKKRV